MQDISDEQFNELISRAIDEMPVKYISNLNNVVISYADEPTLEQVGKLKLRGDHLLLGLYEGIPLTSRGAGYNLILPDKITLFKRPLLTITRDEESFYRQVKHTLWHEIAHYYGLDHNQIHAIEARWK